MKDRKILSIKFNFFQQGFTLIELLVVISIMGLLMGAVIANYAGQRIPRSLRIAQNEMVTNIREAQSYTLSSRNVSGNIPANYYLLKFDTAMPTQYFIQAIYNSSNPPVIMQPIETINLPINIKISSVTIGGVPVSTGCALLAFKLPFAKVIENNGCAIPQNPVVASGDDYYKLVTFISNGGGTTSSDIPMVITLSSQDGTLTKTITISGTTGVITFQ